MKIYSSTTLFALLLSLSLSALLFIAPTLSASSSSNSLQRGSSFGTLAVDDELCQGVDCGPNGKCAGGVCTCKRGFGGPNCEIPPSITIANVTVPSTIGQTATVRWTSTGNFPDVSVFLFPAGGQIFGVPPLGVFPTYVRRNAPNTGRFDFPVSTAISGAVKVGVGFSGTVNSFTLQNFAIDDPCAASVNCGTNGDCFQGKCQCRNGFSGDRCEINPCPVDQCNLRGTCNRGVCTCDAGFRGTRCEINARTCNGVCDNGGLMDPSCTKCQCAGSWGNAGCRTCLLQCAANTVPDSTCTQCICAPGWGGTLCNVPFSTVVFKLKDMDAPSIILPPNAPQENIPFAQAKLRALTSSLAQDIAYALSIPADRVNITNTEADTPTSLVVTVQLLATPNALASAVTSLTKALTDQAANATAFDDSLLALGQVSYKIDTQFSVKNMKERSADGGGALAEIRSTTFRYWIFILAGVGGIGVIAGSICHYLYKKKSTLNKNVTQLAGDVELGTGNSAPVQRLGAKGYDVPASAAPIKNTGNSPNASPLQSQFGGEMNSPMPSLGLSKVTTAYQTSPSPTQSTNFGAASNYNAAPEGYSNGNNTTAGYPAAGTVGGRNGEWIVYYSEQGAPYWYNNQNGVSSWSQPVDF